jgi:hypothetical protein
MVQVRDHAESDTASAAAKKLLVEGSPKLDHFLPVALLIPVEFDPGVAVVAWHLRLILELGADNSLVVVGSGVQEVS